MVRRVSKILAVIIVIFGGLYVWLDQSRSFYCLSDDKCVTVWKRVGGKCYIIPEKYYGLLTPKEYIETENSNAVTLLYDKDSNFDYVISSDYGNEIKIVTPSLNIKNYSYKDWSTY